MSKTNCGSSDWGGAPGGIQGRGAMVLSLAFTLLLLLASADVFAERIKDLATVKGVRSNPLVGYGVVVGLDGTGDQTTQTPFTTQGLTTMLSQLGVQLPPGQSLQLKNVAAVMVTAGLPAFAQPGQALDVTVSSMGNAKSLRGGTLLLTPLKGPDGQIYALAQGSLVIPGAGGSGAGGKVQVNQLNSGRIPAGALVERGVATPFAQTETIDFELNRSDFSLASSVSEAINRAMGPGSALALDARRVQVKAPIDPGERVGMMAKLENLDIETPMDPAKVVVNARTGTVTMNRAVTLDPVAIAHGNLTLMVKESPQVSQPGALSAGQTAVTPQTDVQIKQDPGQLVHLKGAAQLSDVVKALNSLGVTPADLLAILQALKANGALRAELEVI